MKIVTGSSVSMTQILNIFDWILASVFLLFAFTYIFLTYYLGRTKMKEIDQLVYGYEIPSDSIFFQGLRMMDYGGAFAWRFYARRIGKEWIRERFNKKIQRLFILNFWLIITSGFSLCLAVILNKFFLHIGYQTGQ